MRFWLRSKMSWVVLAATLLSLPGPASKACACPRDVTESQVAAGAKSACPRCSPSAATLGTAASPRIAQISRSSCCKSKVTDARSATTPAKIQLDRHETRTTAPAAIAPSPANRSGGTRGARASPARGTRDSASPPASYLSDFLRL